MSAIALDPTGIDDRARRDAGRDRLFRRAMAFAGWAVLLALAGAALSMLMGGRLALETFGWRFFTSSEWDAGGGHFGALIPIFGTVVSSVIAMVIAVPVSFGIALFLTEVAPAWLRTPLATTLELLAGIPSIVYGMWGLFVLVPILADPVYPWILEHLAPLPVVGRFFDGYPIGISLLAAGLVLSVMIIPFISSVMREVFLTVPSRLKESAYALGSTRWEVVWDVVLPYTRSAVVGGIFLGLGRALGETMAVTYIIGNAYEISAGLLFPGSSIASTIANEFGEAVDPLHKSSLLALGFTLFVLTFLVLGVARFMLMRLQRRAGN